MNVFITGGTGYIGRHLIPELIVRGHTVRALARLTSIDKLPDGADGIVGDALRADTFASRLAPSDTLIHLVGVAHPSPAKAEEFRRIDLVSIRETVRAAIGSSIRHIVYLSVAHPAPMMQDYIAVREEGERLLRESGIASTFIRPWYVLGPDHRWPYALLPLYWLWAAFPSQRETAHRLYPVKLRDVVRVIADAVDRPPLGVRVVEAGEMMQRRPSQNAAPDPASEHGNVEIDEKADSPSAELHVRQKLGLVDRLNHR